MFFISNFIYALVFSIPIMVLAPQETDYRQIRESKPVTVSFLGAEYRPSFIESLSGGIAVGFNWDFRYQAFETSPLSAERSGNNAIRDPYIEASRASKFSFYVSYYPSSESSFYIGLVNNIVRVPLKYKFRGKDNYANAQDKTAMRFLSYYIGYGAGVGWHCIWEGGFSVLVGLDFTLTNNAITSVDSIDSVQVSGKTKAAILDQYENEHLFPISTKFMIGYSF